MTKRAKRPTNAQICQYMTEICAIIERRTGIRPTVRKIVIGRVSEWQFGTNYDDIPKIIVQTPLGAVELSGDCDKNGASVFIQYLGPMTYQMQDCARQVAGNTHSDKMNWHASPDDILDPNRVRLAYLSRHLRIIMGARLS